MDFADESHEILLRLTKLFILSVKPVRCTLDPQLPEFSTELSLDF